MDDNELSTLSEIDKLFKKIESPGALARTLNWIVNKYGQKLTDLRLPSTEIIPASHPDFPPQPLESIPRTGIPDFPTLADLLSYARHKTATDRFLLAAYWFIKGNLETTFHSNDLTPLLKDAGYENKKVSNAIKSLKNTKPALLIQVSKNSKTKGKNGQLTMKLTTVGIQAAEKLIHESAPED